MMHKFDFLFITVICLVLCAFVSPDIRAQNDSLKTITVVEKDNFTTGTASYYAHKFEGRKTSSGEIFRQDSLTAAHKSLPFGTLVKVTNLSNDSTVVVKINDRLPPSSRRTIDLTYAAARKLNFIKKGLTKVKIEVLKTSPVAKPKKKIKK
jgi:rare lipoprotein A